MSIVKALLFYSKYDRKSCEYRALIDQIEIDVQCISVDNERIKTALLSDSKYSITRVPTLLLLYSNGAHRTYIGAQLDIWFEKVLAELGGGDGNNESEQSPVAQTPVAHTPIARDTNEQKEEYPSHASIGGGTLPISGGEIGTMLPTSISNDPMIQPARKEVSKAGPTPAELAEKMAAFRDEQEQIIENKKKRAFGADVEEGQTAL